MNKTLKDMLIGVLLGDAHIGRTGIDKAFISFEQSSKKREYINYLHNLTKESGLPLIQDDLKEYLREDIRYQTKNKSLYFRTESLEVLKPMADLFLNDDGKKVIPNNIAELLTPLALAIWIMDDGTWKKPGVRIATNCFTKQEVELLKLTLEIKFNLKSSLHKNNDKYQLYIKQESIPLLRELVLPYFVPSMLYKLGL